MGGKWDDAEVAQGSLDDGRYVTLKFSGTGDDILVALGHHDDIQETESHVHAWNQSGSRPDHHDTRWSARIFPDIHGKDEHKDARVEYERVNVNRLRSLVDDAQRVMGNARSGDVSDWRGCTDDMKSLQSQWNDAWRDPDYKYSRGSNQYQERDALRREFKQLQDEFYEVRRKAAELRHLHEDQAKERKERVVAEARVLSRSTDWKAAAEAIKRLDSAWKDSGRCRREDNDRLYAEFKSAKEAFFDSRRRHFEELDRQSDTVKRAKESLVREAERLALSKDWKATSAAYRSLMDKWKAAGRCKREDEERLWTQFNKARETFSTHRERHFEKLKNDQARGLRERESIVREVQSASRASDLKSAREAMRVAIDRWKSAPRASRPDEDRLWKEIQRARDDLNRRQDVERQERERKQAHAKSVKERIITRAAMLVNTNDFKGARQEMKSLMLEWKSAGRASRDDEDRLWQAFNGARERFNEAAQAEWERSKRERINRMTQAVQNQRDSLANTDNRIRETEARLSDLYSRPNPSPRNPRHWEIVSKRNQSISNQQSKLQNLQTRRHDIINRIGDMESKLRSMY